MAYEHTNSKGVTYHLNSKKSPFVVVKSRLFTTSAKTTAQKLLIYLQASALNENPRNGFLTVKRG